MMTDPKVNEAVEAIEALCPPGFMSKAEAIDFLEDVIDRLQSSIEALREEVADED